MIIFIARNRKDEGYMNYIGRIIREIRERKGLTRQELVDKICTVKYLYFIERGERNPSAEILRLLSLRLGVDLFEYYEFLNCEYPFAVHDAIKKFVYYRQHSDIVAAKKHSDQVQLLPDFQKPPWKYEISVSNASYMAYVENRYQDCIDYIMPILENMEPCYMEEEYVANFLILLSSSYFELNDLELALKAIIQAEDIAEKMIDIPRYNITVISVKLNRISYYHYTGDFDKAIIESLKIEQIQRMSNSYAQVSFIYYYIAYSYYKKGMFEDAFSWFEKCLLDLIIHHNNISAFYISNYEHFYDMLYHPKTSPYFVDRVSKQYNLEKPVK